MCKRYMIRKYESRSTQTQIDRRCHVGASSALKHVVQPYNSIYGYSRYSSIRTVSVPSPRNHQPLKYILTLSDAESDRRPYRKSKARSAADFSTKKIAIFRKFLSKFQFATEIKLDNFGHKTHPKGSFNFTFIALVLSHYSRPSSSFKWFARRHRCYFFLFEHYFPGLRAVVYRGDKPGQDHLPLKLCNILFVETRFYL